MGTGRPSRRRFPLVLVGIVVAAGAGLALLPPSQRPVTEEEARAALQAAREKLGAPYEWGARGPDRFDSSGIIVHAYRQAIPNLRLRGPYNRLLADASHAVLYRWNFEPLPLEELVPGDLVYITDGSAPVTHGALFVRWIEPLRLMVFLDASSREGVRQVGLQVWPIHEEVRGQWFVAAGRLKVVVPFRPWP